MRALPLLLALAACKQAGTHHVLVDGEEACAAGRPLTASVLVVEGGACGACTCEECVAQCATRPCQVTCPGEGCPLDQSGDALNVDPGVPGAYAFVVTMYARDDAGVPHLVGTACAELDLDADGTGSEDVTATAACCEPPP